MNIEQNVLFNEIEVTNTPVSITEEQEKLNNEFIETVFNACKSYVDSCCCSARDAFIKRCDERARMSIITPHSPVELEPDDELIDNFKFGVIIHSRGGLYVDAPLIVRECKTCHKLSFYGSANAVSTLLAIDDTNAINNGEISITGENEIMDEEKLVQTLSEAGISDVEIVDADNVSE